MSNPMLGIKSSVLLKKESVQGTRESLATGAVHIDLISETLDHIPVMTDLPQIVGNRQKRASMAFVSHNDGGGSLICRPRNAQMAQLLELILGPTGALIVDDASDLSRFTLEVNKANTDKIALIGCKVNTAKFNSIANEPLTLDLGIIASKGDRNSGVFTAWAPTQVDTENPYMHGGLVMSGAEPWLNDGVTSNVETRSIEFILSNNLITDAFCNDVNRRLIPLGLFSLEGNMEIPYNTITKGFWDEMINANKVKFTATWTNADLDTLVTNFVVKLKGNLPKIATAEPQWLTIDFEGVYDSVDAVCFTMVATEVP